MRIRITTSFCIYHIILLRIFIIILCLLFILYNLLSYKENYIQNYPTTLHFDKYDDFPVNPKFEDKLPNSKTR